MYSLAGHQSHDRRKLLVNDIMDSRSNVHIRHNHINQS